MYTYEFNFKDGKMLAGSNAIIEGDKVILVNYMREKQSFDKSEIVSVIEKRFYLGKVQEKIIFENVEEFSSLSDTDKKTLEACKKDLSEWSNKVFKVELDTSKKEIRVISKRKAMKGKGFIIPLSKELTSIPSNLLEKHIYSKYATAVYLNC